MKSFDWVLLVISIIWFLFNIVKIWSLLDSYEVKYSGATISIGYGFFIPMLMWLLIAYRVGG